MHDLFPRNGLVVLRTLGKSQGQLDVLRCLGTPQRGEVTEVRAILTDFSRAGNSLAVLG